MPRPIHLQVEVVHPLCDDRKLLLQIVDSLPESVHLLPLPFSFSGQVRYPALLSASVSCIIRRSNATPGGSEGVGRSASGFGEVGAPPEWTASMIHICGETLPGEVDDLP